MRGVLLPCVLPDMDYLEFTLLGPLFLHALQLYSIPFHSQARPQLLLPSLARACLPTQDAQFVEAPDLGQEAHLCQQVTSCTTLEPVTSPLGWSGKVKVPSGHSKLLGLLVVVAMLHRHLLLGLQAVPLSRQNASFPVGP